MWMRGQVPALAVALVWLAGCGCESELEDGFGCYFLAEEARRLRGGDPR